MHDRSFLYQDIYLGGGHWRVARLRGVLKCELATQYCTCHDNIVLAMAVLIDVLVISVLFCLPQQNIV